MSAFAIQAWHFEEAAKIIDAARPNKYLTPRFALAAAGLHHDHVDEAVMLFGRLFDPDGDRGKFAWSIEPFSKGHMVIALLLFAAICHDEECEEEGQL